MSDKSNTYKLTNNYISYEIPDNEFNICDKFKSEDIKYEINRLYERYKFFLEDK